ncbi:nuclear transport factor 2 family protein [Leptobacterium flavescens]|uniref:Nuclear transport factor 2 family protein n=1 Tax=Leptobacterium flavescens TaxID=472055 RepID=A0A6P0UQW8_9FLAO|nr:nuclear transport factor 2 family protein [Leptobacterium flavescens]NER15525.1 nuclear transport factor 2 family protein [Leptobacterium flavescens]
MKYNEIAEKYLTYLEEGNVDGVISLFSENGIVESPLYGLRPASEFYRDLNNDTTNSSLKLDGVFTEEGSRRISLLFDYEWTLKNNKKVRFKVVDIICFNDLNKIEKLTIIYDTVVSRKLLEELKA